MKNNRNIIPCCNNSHHGAPRTGKQTSACASDLGDGSHVICFVDMNDCLSVTSRHECLLRAATSSLSEHIHTVQQCVLDKTTSIQLRITQQRDELADLRRSLSDTDTRLSRVCQSFQTISDDLAELRSEMEVDRYLERTIDKLMQYGRAIRLVVCYVDPVSAGNVHLCRHYRVVITRAHRKLAKTNMMKKHIYTLNNKALYRATQLNSTQLDVELLSCVALYRAYVSFVICGRFAIAAYNTIIFTCNLFGRAIIHSDSLTPPTSAVPNFCC